MNEVSQLFFFSTVEESAGTQKKKVICQSINTLADNLFSKSLQKTH